MSMRFSVRSAITSKPRVRLSAMGLRALVASLAVAGSSCAHVPPEAVDLSQRMGTDLASVHAANRELAISYFATLRARVDAVVDQEYRPFVLGQAIETTHLIEELERSRRPGAELDALDLMQVFVEEAVARIDSFRSEVRAPIDAQEREVLRRIGEAHEALARGNSAITAHLISLRKVHTEQDALMRGAGLPGDTRDLSTVTQISPVAVTENSPPGVIN